jgi:hypothetical protein
MVIVALCFKPKGHGFEIILGNWIFSVYLILPFALCRRNHSASNRNEYEKLLGSRARPALMAENLLLTVSRFARQCESLDTSQYYRPPWHVTGIALLYGDGVCFL